MTRDELLANMGLSAGEHIGKFLTVGDFLSALDALGLISKEVPKGGEYAGLDVQCPVCAAQIGSPCTNPGSFPHTRTYAVIHDERVLMSRTRARDPRIWELCVHDIRHVDCAVCPPKEEKAGDTKGWIGVDLDGTLAYYDGYKGDCDIGPPIPAMVARVTNWLAHGKRVKIFTARANPKDHPNVNDIKKEIQKWCLKHIGMALEVTHEKDQHMYELWDDRAFRVVKNTGELSSQGSDR